MPSGIPKRIRRLHLTSCYSTSLPWRRTQRPCDRCLRAHKSQTTDLSREVLWGVWPVPPSLTSASSSFWPQRGDAAADPPVLKTLMGNPHLPPKWPESPHMQQLPCLCRYWVTRFRGARPLLLLSPYWSLSRFPGHQVAREPRPAPDCAEGRAAGARATLVGARAVWASPGPDCGGDQCSSGSLHLICDAFEH